MKRNKKLYIVLIVIILFCTGCDGTMTRDIRHAGFILNSEFTCSEFYPQDKDDLYYKKIKYFTSSHVIDEDGKIYELSLSKKYSDGQNCKEVYTSLRVQAIMDNKIIKAQDNKYYYLTAENNNPSYSEVPQTDNSYATYDLLLKSSDIVKVESVSGNSGVYYVLKSDGNVYEVIISTQDRNTPPRIISNRIVYNRMDYGELIVDFNYFGDSIYTFVKTQGKVFRMMVQNPEDCQYPDIPCDYQMEEDELFNKYGNRIIVFNGSTLITDYKKVFSLQKS